MNESVNFQRRFLKFSASILKFTTGLPRTRAGRHIADQLLRSGTSVGAQFQEARAAESRADFLHKMQIGLKEIREAGYWLDLIQEAQLMNDPRLAGIRQECAELTAILAKSVITAKKNS